MQCSVITIFPKEEWNEYFSSHWKFAGVRQTEHIAMFPEEVPNRLIKMFSFVGETVLDPFLGSGTTSLAAKNLGRNSIGYEINQGFKSVICEKVGLKSEKTDNDFSVTFEIDIFGNHYSYDKLPYIFADPHKLDKITDIKKLYFGSKIDGTEIKS